MIKIVKKWVEEKNLLYPFNKVSEYYSYNPIKFYNNSINPTMFP